MANISVIILTYNEELHIARAIASVRSVATEVFVVDSYSSDTTVEIARRSGAAVVQRRFVHQAEQLQWALENLPVTGDWIMRLDADEYIDPVLAQTIAERIDTAPVDVTGLNLDRRHIFMGRWIRHGGRYPVTLLRLWRKGAARVEQRWMDEHVVLDRGRAVTLSGGVFADHNLKPLSDFIAKHNSYSSREALQVQLDRLDPGSVDAGAAALSSRQARLKRGLKLHVYNKIPFPIAAFSYFAFRYVFQFGFLDGVEGLIYHFLQGFWYRFLVGAKVREMDAVLGGVTGADARRAALYQYVEGR